MRTMPLAAVHLPRAPRRSAAWVLVLALCVGAGAAWAADPPKPAKAQKPAPKPAPKFAPGKPIEPVMSREELRECMDRQAKLRENTAQASQSQGELEREKSEIQRDGEALKAELVTLDRSDAAAVEAYNARASARDRRIDAFEPRVAEFNTRVQALADERAAFTRLCENRKFDEKDEKALQKP